MFREFELAVHGAGSVNAICKRPPAAREERNCRAQEAIGRPSFLAAPVGTLSLIAASESFDNR